MSELVSRLHSFNSQPKQDSTIDVTFVIHDFELSGNGQLITEEVCIENMATLLNKPILAKYYSLDETDVDHFGDHEVALTTNRDTGDWMPTTETTAIGVFTNVYIDEVEGKRCLLADGVLWSDRYYNSCSLLYEWYSTGIRTKSSCEYLYSNYEVKDGVQYVKSDIVYEGLAILNSSDRGDYGVVSPAYESSHMVTFDKTFSKAICQDINNFEKGEDVMTESINDIQVDVQEEVLETPIVEEVSLNEEAVEPIIEAVETIIEVVETTIEAVETEIEAVETEIEKTEVEGEPTTDVESTELDKYKELEEKLNETIEKLAELEGELQESKSAKIEADAEIGALNAMIESLNEYKARFEAEEHSKALNDKKAMYKERFEKFGAMETFESEEVQALIEKSLCSETEVEAKLQLSEMLIELGMQINSKVATESNKVVEKATSLNNLIPSGTKFEDLYGFKK